MLPTRDRRYFASAAAGVGALGAFGLCPPAMAWVTGTTLLANAWRGWVSVYPYDRILSATSTDGLAWKPERGVRIDVAGRSGDHPGGAYFPYVVRLDDQSWRMYFRGSDVDRVLSARSDDGLHWSIERGIRIDVGGQPRLDRVSCPRVIQDRRGDLRMFFTGRREGSSGFSVYSAASSDGLSWTRDAGPLYEPGAGGQCQSIFSFCLARASDGPLRMYYEGLSATISRIHLATSEDGAHWTHHGVVLKPGPGEFGLRSPWVIATSGSQWRMYFAAGSPHRSLGASIHSATSDDGVRWVREPGVRVAHAGRYAGDGLLSPSVVPISDGRLRMYYGGYWGPHLLAPVTRWRHKAR